MRYLKTRQIVKISGNIRKFFFEFCVDVKEEGPKTYLILEEEIKMSFVSKDNENWAPCGPVDYLLNSGFSAARVKQILLKEGWRENTSG